MTTNLTAAQRQQVLSYMAETAASKTLTAQQLAELSIDQRQALVDAGIITKKQLRTGATITLTKAELKKIIADDAILTKDKQLILSAFGVTEANLNEASSWEILGKSAGKTLLLLAKNPLTWVVVGVVALTAAYANLASTAESAAEAQEKLKEAESDLVSARNELTGINDKIAEIKSKGGELGISSHAELDRLKTERAILKDQVRLLELKKELAADKSNREAVKAATGNKKEAWWTDSDDYIIEKATGYTDSDDDGNYETKVGGEEGSVFETIDDYEKEIEEIEKEISEWESKPDSDKKSNKLIKLREKKQEVQDKITEHKDDLADIYLRDTELMAQITGDDPESVAAREKLQNEMDFLEQYIYTKKQLAKIKFDDFIKDPNNKAVSEGFKDIQKDGEVTTQEIADLANKFPALSEYMSENGITAEVLAAEYANVSDESKNTSEYINEMASPFSSLLGNTTTATEKLSKLGDALNGLREDGYISVDSLSELRKEFSNVEGIDGYIQSIIDAGNNTEKVKSILSTLAVEQVKSTIGVENLTEANRNLIVNMLKSAEVKNADAVATKLIAEATAQATVEEWAATGAISEHIENLDAEAGALGITTEAYIKLIAEQMRLGNTDLDLSGQIQAMEKFAKAIGMPLAEIKALQYIMECFTYDEEKGVWVGKTPLPEGHRDAGERTILSSDAVEKIISDSWSEIEDWISSSTDDTDIDFKPDNSSKDKTQKSLDYTTFLDEQITDLQNKAKRLEDQISITEQQIANAEARGDTALANALKAQLVSQNEELQAIYHEVAEGLRRIKEEAAAELFGKGSDEYNRIIQDGEYLSEEWIAQRIRELEAEKIRIENAGGDTTAIENEIKQVEELSGVINDCTDGIYEQQSAWWDVNTAIQDAKKEIINGYSDELDRATEKLTRGLQEQADAYDILIDKKEALLEADRKEIDCQREIRELQRNIQSELNASKTMTEYLDEDTRKLLFNEDDYNHLSSKLQGIATDIGDINDWYYSEINALTEDNWYLEEAITNEYERRLDAKMKEYELAEAELNLEKKKQQLNNAMNEKNVRMYIDGSWQYVADIDEVVRAQKELAEAQGEYDEIKQQQEEEAQLDKQERELDNLKTEQSAIEKQIEMIEDQTDKIKTAMEEYLEPIRDLEDIISDIASMTIPGLQTELDKFISMIRKANGTDTGGTVVTGGGSTRPGKGYIDPSVADITAPEPNASAWIPGIGNAGVYINPSTGKTEADLPVGTIITPNGSDTSWEITGGTQGDYTSVIVPNDKKHAEGVLSAPKGLSLINDGNGLEMLRTKLGDLVYMNGGETVFNGDQTRFLYNLSKNPMSYLGALAGQNNAGEQNIHNFYGDIVIEDVNDPNEFMQKLTTMLKHNSFK